MLFDLQQFRAPCPCGQDHPVTVRGVSIGPGVLGTLPGILRREGWSQPCMVCDENTYRAAGHSVERLLPQCKAARVSPNGLHADEHGVQAVREKLPYRGGKPFFDVLLAVGSGTVHDLTRYLAHETGVPFLSVPTAASVDGFVSTVAAMTWEGVKTTLPAVAPLYVVADSDIFSRAPRRLTASGFGDLLGKMTALADWEASQLVTGESYCERIAGFVRSAVEDVCGALGEIASGQKDGCEKLMYGLLLSGMAMQMTGNSRPASGAEHHISHLWEMEVLCGPLDALHGEKVGLGLLLAAREYRYLADGLRGGTLQEGPRPDAAREIREGFPAGMAPLIERENTPDPLETLTAQDVLAQRDALLQVLDTIPDAARLERLLKEVGGVTRLEQIGLSDEVIPATLSLSPYVRRRLTVMRLRKLFM